MIEADALAHTFGAVRALDGVSFQIPKARLFALLGPNGSGKTTLFRILTTLLVPQTGRARVDGSDVVIQRRAVLTRLGVVFQRPSLDGKLTAMENLTYHGPLFGLSGSTLRKRVSELLERFGVADRAGSLVATLSGGLQRRVELAKCMLHRPAVLILDEPCTGLDPAARATLMNYLRALRDQDGVTALLTTHGLDEAEACDTVAILDLGRLVALDSPTRLKEKIGGDVLSIEGPAPEALASKIHQRFGCAVNVVDGVIIIERERGHEFVPQLVEAFPGEIRSLSVGKPTLGDVFLHLTGHGLNDAGRVQTVQERSP